MGPDKGTAGTYTFYERKGKTIMRIRSNRRSDRGRTAKNMASRTLTSNLVHQWRVFGGALHDCFETKKAGATDYNGYRSVNRRTARVHLTKLQSEGMVTIVDNICVSSGSLQPVVQVVEREGVDAERHSDRGTGTDARDANVGALRGPFDVEPRTVPRRRRDPIPATHAAGGRGHRATLRRGRSEVSGV